MARKPQKLPFTMHTNFRTEDGDKKVFFFKPQKLTKGLRRRLQRVVTQNPAEAVRQLNLAGIGVADEEAAVKKLARPPRR